MSGASMTTPGRRPAAVQTGGVGTRRVVAGVDGSTAAGQALIWAAAEAGRRGATLVVVHALEGVPPYQAPYAPASGRVDREWARQEGGALLDRAATDARRDLPFLRVERYLVELPAAKALLEYAAGADLLVLGGGRAQPAGGGGRIGATALDCLRWAPCPVVMVPAPG
ncbi:universal stress protein [Nonomuraea sp. NPDC003727]